MSAFWVSLQSQGRIYLKGILCVCVYVCICTHIPVHTCTDIWVCSVSLEMAGKKQEKMSETFSWRDINFWAIPADSNF